MKPLKLSFYKCDRLCLLSGITLVKIGSLHANTVSIARQSRLIPSFSLTRGRMLGTLAYRPGPVASACGAPAARPSGYSGNFGGFNSLHSAAAPGVPGVPAAGGFGGCSSYGGYGSYGACSGACGGCGGAGPAATPAPCPGYGVPRSYDGLEARRSPYQGSERLPLLKCFWLENLWRFEACPVDKFAANLGS